MLPIPEGLGSNPVSSKIYDQHIIPVSYRKVKNKEKSDREWPIFKLPLMLPQVILNLKEFIFAFDFCNFFLDAAKNVAHNKNDKSFNFTKIYEIEKSNFVVTFNNRNIFAINVRSFEQIDVFQRRFGHIRDVCVDLLNVYVVGSVGNVVKYKMSFADFENGVDEVDFVTTVKMIFLNHEAL